MTTVYIVRHAEAEGNIYRRIHGQYNSNLTEKGLLQVAALEERFRPIHLDAVYSSDLRRCRMTARALYEPKGLPLHLNAVDDNAVCIYQMSGGALGTMTASWTYYGPEDNSTVIYGTKGIMRIYDDPAHSIVVDLASGERELYDVEAIQTNDNQTASGVIDAFVSCIERGTEPAITGASVLPAMRAVFASIESSKTGAKVSIPLS